MAGSEMAAMIEYGVGMLIPVGVVLWGWRARRLSTKQRLAAEDAASTTSAYVDWNHLPKIRGSGRIALGLTLLVISGACGRLVAMERTADNVRKIRIALPNEVLGVPRVDAAFPGNLLDVELSFLGSLAETKAAYYPLHTDGLLVVAGRGVINDPAGLASRILIDLPLRNDVTTGPPADVATGPLGGAARCASTRVVSAPYVVRFVCVFVSKTTLVAIVDPVPRVLDQASQRGRAVRLAVLGLDGKGATITE